MMGAMASITSAEAFIKATGGAMPLYQILFLRGLLTTSFLFFLTHRFGGLQWPRTRGVAALLMVRNLGEAGGAFFYLSAVLSMPLANVKAILQFMPLLLTLGAFVFYREPFGWRRLIAILIGFGGMLLIVRPGPEGLQTPVLLALVAVLFATMRDLVTRKLPQDVSSVTITLSASVTVTVFAGLLSPFTTWQPVTLPLGLLIIGAAFSMIAGYFCIVQSMRHGEVSFVAVFRYSGLLWGLLFGWMFFDEWPDNLTVIGAAILVGTVFFRENRLARPPTRRLDKKEPMG